MKRILVTTDGSPASAAVMPVAAEIARATGAEVHLLRVREEPNAKGLQTRLVREPGSVPSFLAMSSGGVPAVHMRSAAERRDQAVDRIAHETMDELNSIASEAFAGLPTVCHAHLGSQPADDILALARELDVDLIAMSTHGKSALASVLQGSVAAAVVRAGIAPVLLVRPRSLAE